MMEVQLTDNVALWPTETCHFHFRLGFVLKRVQPWIFTRQGRVFGQITRVDAYTVSAPTGLLYAADSEP